MKKLLSSLFALVLLLGSLGAAMAEANAAFTPEELTAFDGKDGRKAYVAVEGKVYDVTGVPLDRWPAQRCDGRNGSYRSAGQSSSWRIQVGRTACGWHFSTLRADPSGACHV